MTNLLIYSALGLVSLGVLLCVCYHEEGGIDTKNLLLVTFFCGIIWPVGLVLMTACYIKEKLEKIERNNNGYLIRKPTKEEMEQRRIAKFNNDVDKTIK